jgi:hypothetical protein
MVFNLPSTLKLEVVLVHQGVGDGLGVLRTDDKVICVRCNVLIMIVDTSHPDIWFGFAKGRSPCLEDIQRSVHASVDLRNKVRTVLCRYICTSRSPNSGPAMIKRSSDVLASK